MSTLFLRGNKVHITYELGFKRFRRSTGLIINKPVKRSGKVMFPKHVLEWKTKFDADLFHQNNSRHQPKIFTLDSLLNFFIDNRGSTRKKSTQYLYRLAFRKLKTFFGGNININKIERSDILKFRTYLIELEGANNASRVLRSAGAVFNWAYLEHFISSSPITRDAHVKYIDKKVEIYTDAELEKMFLAMETPVMQQLKFLLLSGFRSDESCQLTWDSVDFERLIITVPNKMGGDDEEFPFYGKLKEFLKTCPTIYSPYVFKMRGKWWLNKQLHEAIDKTDIVLRGRNVHTFRKTFLSRLLNSGEKMNHLDLMKIARHKSISTTAKHYLKFENERLISILDKTTK